MDLKEVNSNKRKKREINKKQSTMSKSENKSTNKENKPCTNDGNPVQVQTGDVDIVAEITKNLKRETDDIARLNKDEKAYKKRQIVSNWSRYQIPEEIDSKNDGYSIDSLEDGSFGNGFRFKHEKEWDKSATEPLSSFFNLNLKTLANNLAMIPFYERQNLRDVLPEEEIKRMDKMVEKCVKQKASTESDSVSSPSNMKIIQKEISKDVQLDANMSENGANDIRCTISEIDKKPKGQPVPQHCKLNPIPANETTASDKITSMIEQKAQRLTTNIVHTTEEPKPQRNIKQVTNNTINASYSAPKEQRNVKKLDQQNVIHLEQKQKSAKKEVDQSQNSNKSSDTTYNDQQSSAGKFSWDEEPKAQRVPKSCAPVIDDTRQKESSVAADKDVRQSAAGMFSWDEEPKAQRAPRSRSPVVHDACTKENSDLIIFALNTQESIKNKPAETTPISDGTVKQFQAKIVLESQDSLTAKSEINVVDDSCSAFDESTAELEDWLDNILDD